MWYRLTLCVLIVCAAKVSYAGGQATRDEAPIVQGIADKFKGTHDIAGAAGELHKQVGSSFVYDNEGTAITNASSQTELYGVRAMNCYEFVHYSAYLAGNQRTVRGRTPWLGASASSVYVWNDYTVWDRTSSVPRGKVVVFVAHEDNNRSGYYHCGISLGNGQIAHNTSTSGSVQISKLSDVDSSDYREVRISDYNWKAAQHDSYDPAAATKTSSPASGPGSSTTPGATPSPVPSAAPSPAPDPRPSPAPEPAPAPTAGAGPTPQDASGSQSRAPSEPPVPQIVLVDPQTGAPLPTLHLGQSFGVKVVAPEGTFMASGEPLTLTTPDGQTGSLTLRIHMSDGTFVAGPVSIGGEAGGFDHRGTIGGISLEDWPEESQGVGTPVTLSFGTGPATLTSTVFVYSTKVWQAVASISDSFDMISGALVAERQMIQAISNDPNTTPEVRAELPSWQAATDRRLQVLTMARENVNRVGTPIEKLLVGQHFLDELLTQVDDHFEIASDVDPRRVLVGLENVRDELDQRKDDLVLEFYTGYALMAYVGLTEVTGAAPVYTLATGETIFREDVGWKGRGYAAVNLGLGYVLMKLPPAAVNFLAGGAKFSKIEITLPPWRAPSMTGNVPVAPRPANYGFGPRAGGRPRAGTGTRPAGGTGAGTAGGRLGGVPREDVDFWLGRTPDARRAALLGNELAELDRVIASAEKLGTPPHEISAGLGRLRQNRQLSYDDILALERELHVAALNNNGNTIIVQLHTRPSLVEGPHREYLVDYAGNVPPERMIELDLILLAQVKAKVELRAAGRPQTWSQAEIDLVANEVLPAGEGALRWREFSPDDMDAAGFQPIFSKPELDNLYQAFGVRAGPGDTQIITVPHVITVPNAPRGLITGGGGQAGGRTLGSDAFRRAATGGLRPPIGPTEPDRHEAGGAGAYGPFSRNDLISAARDEAVRRWGPEAAGWDAYPGPDGSVQVRAPAGPEMVVARPATNDQGEPVIRKDAYWFEEEHRPVWHFEEQRSNGMWIGYDSQMDRRPPFVGRAFEPESTASVFEVDRGGRLLEPESTASVLEVDRGGRLRQGRLIDLTGGGSDPLDQVRIDRSGILAIPAGPARTSGGGSDPPLDRVPIDRSGTLALLWTDGLFAGNPPATMSTGPDRRVQIMVAIIGPADRRAERVEPATPSLPWLARTLAGAIRRLLRPDVPAASSALDPHLRPADTSWARRRARLSWAQDRPVPDPKLRVYLRSTGVSTGEAFSLRVVNDGNAPLTLIGEGVVVEPLPSRVSRAVHDEMARAPRDRSTNAPVDGYCLEFEREPPATDTMFRIASREMQQQFEPVRRIIRASRELRDAGALSPDSDPTEYFHAIRQWAIWTREQGFDLDTFGDAFAGHTQKNLAASGRTWTREIEQLVRKFVPGRWEDIQQILERAAPDGGRR